MTRTATNPQTGERVQYNEQTNQWEPIPSAEPEAQAAPTTSEPAWETQPLPPSAIGGTPQPVQDDGRITLRGDTPFEAGLYSFGSGVLQAGAGVQALVERALGKQSGPGRQRLEQLRQEQAERTEAFPVASTVGSIAPYFMVPGAAFSTIPRAAVSGAAIPAVMTGGDPTQTAIGAAAGPAGLVAGRAVGAGYNRLMSGEQLNPAQVSALQAGQRVGMQGTPAMQTGSRPLQTLEATMESSFPTAGVAARFADRNQEALNRAVANAMGESGDAITPEMLGSAADRIGDVMSDVAQRTTGQADDAFMAQLDAIRRQGQELIIDEADMRKLEKLIGYITPRIDENTGAISGQNMDSISKRLRKKSQEFWRNPNADKDLAEAASNLSDAFEDLLARSASGDDLQALKQARSQWGMLRDLEKANAVKAGNVSAQLLHNRWIRERPSYRRGRTSGQPVTDALRFSTSFPKAFGSSGTAERMQMQTLMNALLPTAGGGVGAGLGYLGDNPTQGAAYGALAGVAPYLFARGYYGANIPRIPMMPTQAVGGLGARAAVAGAGER